VIPRLFVVLVLVLVACRSETGDSGSPSSSNTVGPGPGVGGSGAGGAAGGFGGQEVGGGGSGASAGGGIGGGFITGNVILQGTVLTPDTFFDGQVLIEGDTITCVAPGVACEGMDPGATVVDTGAVIAPGLIDTHNHILFDIFDEDDWSLNIPATCSVTSDCSASSYCGPGDCACVSGACYYTDHDEWPLEREYGLMLDYKQCLEDASQGKPVWCPLSFDGPGSVKCEMHKWGELKGIAAGTTSIVGLPGTTSGCVASVARSVDVSQNDLGEDKIQTSALFPPSASSANGVCANYTDGDTNAYLIHVAEGVTANALNEFSQLFSMTTPPGCLYAPQTTITHGTALGAAEFAQMAAAGMKLTWSPASNVALYGTTTDIPAALAAGVLVSLGPDWSMGGSQNLLDELRFARSWSNANWAGLLSNEDLVHMVTTNAAAVLALSNRIGRLEAGMLADVIVIDGNTADPYAAVVDATPASVDLVMVGGVVLYGSTFYQPLMPAAPGCDPLTVCGASKLVCVAESDSANKLDQTFPEIESALQAGLSTLDAVTPLAPSACNNACSATQECFLRTSVPQVPAGMCAAACGAGQACFQTSANGFGCLSINVCSDAKTNNMAPLTPLVKCP
jgi:hypothetical protein